MWKSTPTPVWISVSRRADIDAHASPGVLPTLPAFYTGKYERMFALLVEDGEFEFATKRSAHDRLPHLPM
ncbi:hypothetical protein, partial [Mesorhizobium sp. M7A.F.Ca.US.005.03.2.1]|uniref:hypothetical protein n=1 Tax=Mesorhizobium sp. M7A.F.Ca.US.005.03.2.1 TaxID=2496737 RepID=UPI0019D29A18